jgi:hypothetical protein
VTAGREPLFAGKGVKAAGGSTPSSSVAAAMLNWPPNLFR